MHAGVRRDADVGENGAASVELLGLQEGVEDVVGVRGGGGIEGGAVAGIRG